MRRFGPIVLVALAIAAGGFVVRGAAFQTTPTKPLPSGSWWLSSPAGYPDLPTFAAFSPDGAVTAGHLRWWHTDYFGTWQPAADGSVDLTLRAFEMDEHATARYRVAISGHLTFDAARAVWTGRYRIDREPMSVGDPTTQDGEWELSRIEVEPLP